jgi:two-component system chemotaxis response regulator CheB
LKILIAEDDPTSSLLLTKTLQKDGYEVVACANGLLALEALRRDTFDAVITDWMMPEMDGITMVRRARAEFDSLPPLLVVTALSSGDAKQHALDAGADDYLAKPYQPQEILRRLRNCIQRAGQPAPQAPPTRVTKVSTPVIHPRDAVLVGIAASTGGPEALRAVLPGIEPGLAATYLVVLHGPGWMLETFAERMQSLTQLDVKVAEDQLPLRADMLLVAPGDVHMVVDPKGTKVRLSNEPPENFVRPAADPLLRSMAVSHGSATIAVVLTGMGRDGALGAQQIHSVGGHVIAQDPATAVASSMPRSAVALGVADDIRPLAEIGTAISRAVRGRVKGLARV